RMRGREASPSEFFFFFFFSTQLSRFITLQYLFALVNHIEYAGLLPWSPYGECSRTCGSGVTVRTRRCITQRYIISYRSCNIQDCPEGSRDFREEQCSQFDGTDFQGKLYKWMPYYGAENPCELNCMPKGENFFYRHRSAVVDGTPCHPGRRDICVEGVCKVGVYYESESECVLMHSF
uniref:Papilin, proteoglycan like sulfated glycoprotein n=1 Tax=Myripristis murdjan TaxID=586833 RepID=A0A667Z0I3_9TELE